MSVNIRNHGMKWIYIALLCSPVQPVIANPNSQLNNQINRNISDAVNKRISEEVVEQVKQPQPVLSNKRIVSRDQVRTAQTLLNRRGFNAGIADGLIGRKTRRAIRGFQKSNGIKVDGILTEELLRKLQN